MSLGHAGVDLVLQFEHLRSRRWLRMQDVIPSSLLKQTPENASRAVKMFAGVLKYMEEGPLPGAASPAKSQRLELVQKLLHQVSLIHAHALPPDDASRHELDNAVPLSPLPRLWSWSACC